MSLFRQAPALAAFCALTAFAVGAQADEISDGKKVFTQTAQPSCTVCHTLADAGSQGQVGPNLDDMQPSAERVYKAVTDGIGIMPPFKGKLSEAERHAVAAYVASVTGG